MFFLLKKVLLLSQHSHSSCYLLASMVLLQGQRRKVPWALMESAVPEGQHAISPENLWMSWGISAAGMAVQCCRHLMRGPNWIYLAHQLLDLIQGHASQLPYLNNFSFEMTEKYLSFNNLLSNEEEDCHF